MWTLCKHHGTQIVNLFGRRVPKLWLPTLLLLTTTTCPFWDDRLPEVCEMQTAPCY
jgi:hypothetical protein